MGNARNKQHEHELVTQAEYARLRGLNRSTVNRQVHRGLIPLHAGKVNRVEADKARRENLYLGRGGKRAARPPAPMPSKVGHLKGMIEEVVAARLRDLDAQTMKEFSAILVGADREWACTAIQLGAILNLIGQKLKFRLAAETNPDRCEWTIAEFVRDGVAGLSQRQEGAE